MKKNLVVIGYGGMGGWHTEKALKSDVVNLRGIYDIKPERRELARSRGIFAYDTYEAVLADPAVDLVTVAVPNDAHPAVVIRALEQGKNAICEKPVAITSAELQTMINASNRSGKLFTVHQNRRWDVDFLAMKQLLKTGEIGELIRVESRIHGSRGIPSDWRGKKAYGGGMLYDWGVHLIDQILQLTDEKVRYVSCALENITNDEVDDGFRLEITFESGKTAFVEVGTLNFIAMPRFYMKCKSGTALIADWRENTKVVKCKYWHESDVLPVETAAGLTKTMAPRDGVTTDTYELCRPESDVHDFYRNVCRAIDGEETQLVTHAQVMRVLKLIEAAFRSAETGARVDFE
ncbi:MAG: Gfo/Idh/MocA family oxidoreductase [Clostridiaceae bacterium]|nr:Gfo/Idh/MocA family oxidoreductase [Clostridiaceae bacterium]